MRFEISKVLDAIERRLCVDPAMARAVLDLSEIVRYQDLDQGRPASMLRLGMVVDALGRQLAEEDVPVYVILPRALLSDADLTSNERMVARRWADDGLVEVVPQMNDRVLEVADILGLPVLSRERYEGHRGTYPWIGDPGRLVAPIVGHGGAALVARVGNGQAAPGAPSQAGVRLMSRIWHCPESPCASFGGESGGDSFFADLRQPEQESRPGAQPPPTLRQGAPTCPRHGARLSDGGPRPAAEALAIRVSGVVRQRFVVVENEPLEVGRAPDKGGIMLGQWLSDEARKWISRAHVRFDLRGGELSVTDVSTNGTGIRPGGSMDEDDRLIIKRKKRVLEPTDLVELYPGVHVGRARNWSSGGVVDPVSVLTDAPTMSLRVVPRS
ncbi:FHA domain-containing protein [Catenuloplanes sp. NPDC051500]|uniref:FHA domain-containing protein n=1 Tax=Catenuloplanes sp. NPDC051500 TaxID=3363959 RepID=UPI0037B454AE